jgi:AraC-like DNA-binding protein
MNVGKFTLSQNTHLPVFPRLIVAHLRASGFSNEQIFHGLSFAADDLSDETFRLDAGQHAQFIKRAIGLTDNLHLALEMKARAFDATSSAVLMLFATSGRLSKALHLITRYNYLYTRTLTARLEQAPQGQIFALDTHLKDTDVSYFAVSCFALFIDTFFKDALEGRHLVTLVELEISKPAGFDAVGDQFGFEMKFDCDRTCVYLDPQLIDKPLKSADPQTARLIADFCEQELKKVDAEVSLVGAVKSVVFDHISAPLSLDQAASMLGLSPRSLRRHLQKSGMTYKAILNDARQELAEKLLLETKGSVSSIAYEVGFDNPSHFGRAFKKWTGQSPSDFRQR